MWLDVSADLSILAKKIVAVKAVDQMNSVVYTELAEFPVSMPKSVLMSMIESRSKGLDSMNRVEKLLTDMYTGQVTPRP